MSYLYPKPDYSKAPTLTCQFCGGRDGHEQVLETHDFVDDDSSGQEYWFCCHPCRDAGQPCETFYKIPELKQAG